MSPAKYPSDWHLEKLETLADFHNGKPLENSIVTEGKYKLITLDSVDIKGNLKTTHKRSDQGETLLLKGDIVTVLSDIAHGDLLGLSAIIPENEQYVLNQRMGLLRASATIYPEYLRLFINHNQHFFRDRGQGTSQRHIYKRDFYDFYVAYPEIEEQKAIAKALADIDELISYLKSLLEKKSLLFSGVIDKFLILNMHDAERAKLGKIALIKTGSKNNNDKSNDGKFKFFVRSDTVEKINSYSYESEAILVPGEGRIGEIFHYVNEPHEVHQRVYRISDIHDDWNLKFVYWFMRRNFGSHALTNTVKATVDSLRLPTFEIFDIPKPKKEEQTEIARILDEFEDELNNLHIEILKYECIKQGMMNDLLTGKVRLI